jgi:hypothetical protein
MAFEITLIKDRNSHPVQDPFSPYKISDQDSVATPDLQFFGYLSHTGDYYLQKWNLTDETFRYYVGSGDYSAQWANRRSLGFDTFDKLFITRR